MTLQSRAEGHTRHPSVPFAPLKAKSVLIRCSCVLSSREKMAVRFVNDYDVRNLHDSLLHALQFVPARRRNKEKKHVRCLVDYSFGLAEPHALNENYVKRCGLTKQDYIIRVARHATQNPT